MPQTPIDPAERFPDHRATFSEWILETKRNTNAKPKKTFDRADWEKIEMEVLSLMGGQGELHSTEALDATYVKEWFTADLKNQQNEMKRLRRKLVYAGEKEKPGGGARSEDFQRDQITFDSIRNIFFLGESAPYRSSR
ncbi:hypothetical protein N7491_007287 [Penicillium cf. griseofulvum]|nr:hypothetical protein N7491_007287 [Penicillium cf. griseofulvum]